MTEELYRRNQAFQHAHQLKLSGAGIREYSLTVGETHHAPNDLSSFNAYDYKAWFMELYTSGKNITHLLEDIWLRAKDIKSHWFSGTRQHKLILTELYRCDVAIVALREDIAEFERCVLLTEIRDRHEDCSLLDDVVRYIDTLTSRITVTINTALTSINTTRLSVVGLLLSAIAVFIAA